MYVLDLIPMGVISQVKGTDKTSNICLRKLYSFIEY